MMMMTVENFLPASQARRDIHIWYMIDIFLIFCDLSDINIDIDIDIDDDDDFEKHFASSQTRRDINIWYSYMIAIFRSFFI